MSLPNIEHWNNIFLPLEPLFTAQTDDYTPLDRDAAFEAAINGQNWQVEKLIKEIKKFLKKSNKS